MEILQNIDELLTVTLFGTLAALSVATASFVYMIRTGPEAEIKRQVGVAGLREVAKGQPTSLDEDSLFALERSNYTTLSSAFKGFMIAFYAFIASLLAAFGFDAISSDISVTVEAADVGVCSSPFATGVLSLGIGASHLIRSN